jgi:carboxylesterase type B
MYDGTSLAEHGVIVVTANYRLGGLGFLNGNWGIIRRSIAISRST